jgi:hypothetical protein
MTDETANHHSPVQHQPEPDSQPSPAPSPRPDHGTLAVGEKVVAQKGGLRAGGYKVGSEFYPATETQPDRMRLILHAKVN